MFILGGIYIGSLWLAISLDTLFYVPFGVATFFIVGSIPFYLIGNW